MWARVSKSNNDPHIIAQFYLECVRAIKGKIIIYLLLIMNFLLKYIGCPTLIRTDRGTENSIVAFLQPSFRHAHADSFGGEQSFQYGRSSANQVAILVYYCIMMNMVNTIDDTCTHMYH